MGSHLAEFEAAMNELRSLYQAASDPQAKADFKAQFEQVVRQKDLYVFGILGDQANALHKLNAILQATITSIQLHMANFPIATLEGIRARLGGTTTSTGATTSPGATTSGPAAAESVVQPGGSSSAGQTVRIDLSASDMDALARVAQSEVGHFGKYGQNELVGGIGGVIDTIINRIAHKDFQDTVTDVVNKPYQFSAINKVGTWQGLKEAAATVQAIVAEHVLARTEGRKCSVRGGVHFLNPYVSSPSAVEQWGKYVVQNHTAVFGNDAKHDVHYHGFAPNYALPRSYTLSYQGRSASFSGDGALLVAADQAKLRADLIRICEEEYAYFGNGAKKEGADPQYRRVGEYWKVLGIPYDGRTMVVNDKGKKLNPAWSSAFISAAVRWAGGGERFKYSQAHCHYVQDFVKGRPDGLYVAELVASYAPQPGDIVHYGREYATSFGLVEAKMAYLADGSYPSHSDIVVSVDLANQRLETIGGNVGSSVDRKRISIDQNGLLLPRTEDGQEYPWIAVLRLVAQ